ncbi:MAG: Elongation factor P--(R)-beta-lysine ligase [Planctomycetota bacterium]
MSVRPMLVQRAAFRATLRNLLDGLGFVEVDTPVLSCEVLPEAHIEPITVSTDNGPARFLQASPEALMKRLLAAGAGSIYQFSRCFRAGERSPHHDTEFVMLEWYQPGVTLTETATLLEQLFAESLGTTGLERTSCTAAFEQFLRVDPVTADADGLAAAVEQQGLQLPEGLAGLPASARWSLCFNLLLAEVVAPQLGHGRPTMLESWPAAEAAFARLDQHDPRLAQRFEVFVKGIELVNGWEEEPSQAVLRNRIEATNAIRNADGRRVLPLPKQLMAAHGESMPEGVGAALGFDRLVMLASGSESIDQVRGFSSADA